MIFVKNNYDTRKKISQTPVVTVVINLVYSLLNKILLTDLAENVKFYEVDFATKQGVRSSNLEPFHQ